MNAVRGVPEGERTYGSKEAYFDHGFVGLRKKVAPIADDKQIKLVIIEGAGHMFQDLYAEDMVGAILEFVDNL
jgi:hypothetical protein